MTNNNQLLVTKYYELLTVNYEPTTTNNYYHKLLPLANNYQMLTAKCVFACACARLCVSVRVCAYHVIMHNIENSQNPLTR